jgi:hypothetical protein
LLLQIPCLYNIERTQKHSNTSQRWISAIFFFPAMIKIDMGKPSILKIVFQFGRCKQNRTSFKKIEKMNEIYFQNEKIFSL